MPRDSADRAVEIAGAFASVMAPEKYLSMNHKFFFWKVPRQESCGLF
jgi:hypothetical protein